MTAKQKSYLKSLMVDAGHAHTVYGPRSPSKGYTTMAMRQSWDAFFGALTGRQASQIIDQLKREIGR